MLNWGEFAEARPDLAEEGRNLLYQFAGVGLGFLATVRPDGGPRVHPMCPILLPDRLFALIIPSPKRNDLLRDGRYSLHSFPPDKNEDAFCITGRAEARRDPALHKSILSTFAQERHMESYPDDWDEWGLFEFLIERCLLTKTTGHGDPCPQHTVWKLQGER
jgi:hypothetical protein